MDILMTLEMEENTQVLTQVLWVHVPKYQSRTVQLHNNNLG